MTDLTWTNARRKLSDLVPWEHNPRKISERQAEILTRSWDKFGQVDPLYIGPGNQLYDGHQRKKVLATLERYGVDLEVDVRVSSRALTEDELKEFTILRPKSEADWNWSELETWGESNLLEWGFDPYELGTVEGQNIDYDELWQGMPEFEQENADPYRKLVVYFACEEDVKSFSERIGQGISGEAKWIWHPKQVRENFLQSSYQDEP